MSTRMYLMIIFVRKFNECLKFYQKVFNLKLLRVYQGKGHPPWAELQLEGTKLALHGGYKGKPYRGGPLAIHFRVKNVRETAMKIRQYGGTIKVPAKKVDFRPAELLIAYEGVFTDPDGNEFDFQQLVKDFPED